MRIASRVSIFCLVLLGASGAAAREPLDGTFVVGVDLGEIPWQGSFKPGITFGYHLDDHVYLGGIFQIGDEISRGDTSFNAQASGLDGIASSRESVSERALLHVRLRPHRLAPFVSAGVVYNGTDTEVTVFDERLRSIGEGQYGGGLTITQERDWGVLPALGLGYAYTFDSGLELSTEWTGAIYTSPPRPKIRIDGELASADADVLRNRIIREFRDTPTNLYHIFHLGLGYAF